MKKDVPSYKKLHQGKFFHNEKNSRATNKHLTHSQENWIFYRFRLKKLSRSLKLIESPQKDSAAVCFN